MKQRTRLVGLACLTVTALLVLVACGGSQGAKYPCGSAGSHSSRGADGKCYCDAGYDWVNANDDGDNRCSNGSDVVNPADADAVGDVPVGEDAKPTDTTGVDTKHDESVSVDTKADEQAEAVVPDTCLVGIPCVADSDCEAGQHCNTKLTPPGCEKLYCGAEGTACDEDAVCESGLFCIYGKCAPSVQAPECEAARASFEKCGGDVVGTWKVAGACASAGGFLVRDCGLNACGGAPTPAHMLFSDAFITFKDNGALTTTIPTVELECAAHVTLPCYYNTCDDYQAFAHDTLGYNVVCQTATDGCDCSRHEVITPTAEDPWLTGSEYDTSGSNFYFYPANGARADGTYCRQGNLLVIEFYDDEYWVLSL